MSVFFLWVCFDWHECLPGVLAASTFNWIQCLTSTCRNTLCLFTLSKWFLPKKCQDLALLLFHCKSREVERTISFYKRFYTSLMRYSLMTCIIMVCASICVLAVFLTCCFSIINRPRYWKVPLCCSQYDTVRDETCEMEHRGKFTIHLHMSTYPNTYIYI